MSSILPKNEPNFFNFMEMQVHEDKSAISKNIFAHSDIFRFMMHMHTLDVDRKIGDFKPSEERPP